MDHCYHAQSTSHQPQHPEPVSSRTVIWWPAEISEPSQSDSGTIPCSEQKQVPIHWEVSRASPCWLSYSTLLELQVNNIQRHKLLKCRQSCLWLELQLLVQMRMQYLPQFPWRKWFSKQEESTELSATCPDLPLFPWMGHSEVLAHSQILGRSSLQSWKHTC